MPAVEPSFLRDLKNKDRRLGVKFNGNNFVITYERGHGEPVNIHRVTAENGGFRQPDKRDLQIIAGGDLASGDSMKERINKLSYASEKIQERMKAKARDDIRHMTLENKNQLIKAVVQKTNQGKGNSTFRRIAPKRSKNTVAAI
jgi:hypothetical protein